MLGKQLVPLPQHRHRSLFQVALLLGTAIGCEFAAACPKLAQLEDQVAMLCLQIRELFVDVVGIVAAGDKRHNHPKGQTDDDGDDGRRP